METSEMVLNTLKKAGKPMKSGEIAEIAGIDKAEVDKVIKKLKKEEMINSPKTVITLSNNKTLKRDDQRRIVRICRNTFFC